MTDVIIASTPVEGHTGPLLQIGAALAGAGHDVVLLGDSRFLA